ncbi:MAG: APC family permease, partial [Clostridiaceae bacterium]|nr:APC family permease [Clostridiaceae bacterium]
MDKNDSKVELKKTLGLLDATALSVGAIIGGGIFVVIGITAGLAGSALVISMIIASVIALFTALSFSELAKWQPIEGSVYEYAHQLISPFSGFLAGFMWIISNTFTGAAVSLGFAYYLTATFPGIQTNVVAAVLCLVFTTINFLGARKSVLLNTVLVIIKLVALVFFIIFGAFYVDTSNFAPFLAINPNVLYGTIFIFFAYTGFARAAVVAEEVKNAKHNVPRAMLLSLGISTLVYVLVGIIAIGLVGAPQLADSNAPLIEAISKTNNQISIQIITVGGLLATASVLLTAILGVSRMTYSMARRKDLPHILSKLHPIFCTPYYAIWITGLLMTGLVLFIDLTKVVAISTFASLFYYAIANMAAIKLKKGKKIKYKIISALGLISCLIM